MLKQHNSSLAMIVASLRDLPSRCQNNVCFHESSKIEFSLRNRKQGYGKTGFRKRHWNGKRRQVASFSDGCEASQSNLRTEEATLKRIDRATLANQK